jgi:DNA-binding transcriptional MerR regulator
MDYSKIGKGLISIKDFSKYTGIPTSALRHYDNKGVYHPAAHGEGIEHKHRYYSPMQITTVKMIRVLREIDIPLDMIKELKENRTPEKIVKLFNASKDIINKDIRFLQEALLVIDTFMDLINEGMSVIETEITVTRMSEKRIILGGDTNFKDSEDFYGEFIRFCNATNEPGLNLSYPIGGYWTDMEAFLSSPSQPMKFFSLCPNGCHIRPEGLYLNGYKRGYYGQTSDLPERMAKHAENEGYVFTGAVYNTYLFDEISVVDPENYLLQVSAAVTEKQRAVTSRTGRYKM